MTDITNKFKKAAIALAATGMVAGGVAYKGAQNRKKEALEKAKTEMVARHARELRQFDKKLNADSTRDAQYDAAKKLFDTMFEEADNAAAEHNNRLLHKLVEPFTAADIAKLETDYPADYKIKTKKDLERIIAENSGRIELGSVLYPASGEYDGIVSVVQKDGGKDVLNKLRHAIRQYDAQNREYVSDAWENYGFPHGDREEGLHDIISYKYDMGAFVKPGGTYPELVVLLKQVYGENDEYFSKDQFGNPQFIRVKTYWPKGKNMGLDISNDQVMQHLKELEMLNNQVVAFNKSLAQRQAIVARQQQELAMK